MTDALDDALGTGGVGNGRDAMLAWRASEAAVGAYRVEVRFAVVLVTVDVLSLLPVRAWPGREELLAILLTRLWVVPAGGLTWSRAEGAPGATDLRLVEVAFDDVDPLAAEDTVGAIDLRGSGRDVAPEVFAMDGRALTGRAAVGRGAAGAGFVSFFGSGAGAGFTGGAAGLLAGAGTAAPRFHTLLTNVFADDRKPKRDLGAGLAMLTRGRAWAPLTRLLRRRARLAASLR